MTTLPTSSSVSKTPAIVTSSSSGTVHSRLSASNSNSRRLRALSRTRGDDDVPVDALDKEAFHPSIDSTATPSPVIKSPELPLYATTSSGTTSAVSKRWQILIWIFYGYCLFSVVFFTAALLRRSASKNMDLSARSDLSPVNDLSTSFRLSKMLSIRPQPVAFYPFALEARKSPLPSDVTMCIWTDMNELDQVESWAKQWKGPISLVTVTNSSNGIEEFKNLAFSRSMLDRLNVHFLQIFPNATQTPNAYLNLARMFSRSRQAVLFPGPLIVEPPTAIYSNLTSSLVKHRAWSESKTAPPMLLSSRKFTPTFARPFEKLMPLLVDIYHPVWCTERFFTVPSREADWEECLWQFWVNSYGALKTHPNVRWTNITSTNNHEKSQTKPTTNELIHRHLVQQFRHETCILAAKRLKDRKPKRGAAIKSKQASWLRKICRQVSV